MADNKNKNDKTLTVKIAIITAVIAVWIICLAFTLSRCDSEKVQIPEEESKTSITTYESKSTGKIDLENSKTLAYFNSHFKDSYYRITETEISSATDGLSYATEIFAYSAQGYVYRQTYQTSFEEMDEANSVTELLTPTNAYVLYPSLKTYFNSEGNSSMYKNTINFTNEYFNTGTVNIRGFEYYCEETTDKNGINTKYCYDKDNNLIYKVYSTSNATITEQYMEYKKEFDPSIFQIPDDYVLQE